MLYGSNTIIIDGQFAIAHANEGVHFCGVTMCCTVEINVNIHLYRRLPIRTR